MAGNSHARQLMKLAQFPCGTLLCISRKVETIQESFKCPILKTIIKTDLANLRFLSFEKGKACQSILIMLRGKIGFSKPEVKNIGCVGVKLSFT